MSVRLTSALSRLLYALVPCEVRGPAGTGLGTTFLFTGSHDQGTVPVLVASRTLVEGAENGRLYFTQAKEGQAALGQHLAFDVPGFHALWHGHPDPDVDLAVAPFGPIPAQLEKAGRRAYVSSLDHTLIPAVEDPDVDVIEEVIVPGFIAGLQDRAHILPITQQGITASPFQVNHDGASAFVVQLPIYPGLSGSPVLLVRRHETPQAGRTERTTGIRLLGVISRVAEWRDGSLSFVAIPPAPPAENAPWAPFALALRAQRIEEAVEDLLRTHGRSSSTESESAGASLSPSSRE